MSIFDRPLTSELTSAIHDVLDGTSASDAWLTFVRERHGPALDVLAHLALSEMALDLLERTAHLRDQDADDHRVEVIENAAMTLSLDVWEEIHDAREVLDRVEALVATAEESDVVILHDDPATGFANTA